jgi:hypothetical protein
VGVVVLLIGGIAMLAWMQADSQEIAEKVLTPDVPAAPEPAEVPGHPGAAVTEPLEGTRAAVTKAAGTVILDLRHADFQIEPGRPGERLRVEASYDTNAYSLEESFEDTEDGSWTYRVEFERTAPWLSTAMNELFGGASPDIRIFLPVDTPMALELKVSEGGAQVELGGLWLTTADLDVARGGFILGIDEPTREPMESFRLRGTMGGVVLGRLGNASPRQLDLGVSMGGGHIDLRGQWVADSEITVKFSMGGGEIQLPRNVAITGLEIDRPAPDLGPEVSPPTLRFTASSDLGDFKIKD